MPGEEDEVEPDDNVPGEEDELEPEYDPSELCVPRAVTWDLSPGPGSTDTMSTPACTDIASCDFGVTSLLIVPDQNGRWKYDYGLWSGTSFSTALVSGLAALAYENAGHNPAQVRCLIEGGGSVKQEGGSSPDPIIGWGIIDIAESLSDSNRSTFLSTCEVSP